MDGNVIVNAIPENYYDRNQAQVLFDNGSFGVLASEGARFYGALPEGQNPQGGNLDGFADEAYIENGNLKIYTVYGRHGTKYTSKRLRFRRTIPTKVYSKLLVDATITGSGEFGIFFSKKDFDVPLSYVRIHSFVNNIVLSRYTEELGYPDYVSLEIYAYSMGGGAFVDIHSIMLTN